MPRLADDRLANAISRVWRDDTPPPSSTAQTIVEDIERRYRIRLPEAFRDYALHAAPSVEWMDDDYISWWSPDNMKNMVDECGPEISSRKSDPEVERERHQYLVFADYMVWCYAYAICCANSPNRGKVILIGDGCHVIADDFTTFVEMPADKTIA